MPRLGDFEQGWPDYEWRWRGATELTPRGFSQPQWRGEDLTGKTILLHAEQGFGDSIQFVRYLPMVARKGRKVILEVAGQSDAVDRPTPTACQHASLAATRFRHSMCIAR